MGLVDFAIRRRVTIAMATVAITLLGFISLSRLKVNLLPDLSYPTLTIRTELPGAAPTEIENLISRPVEEAAGVVRNVRSVRSVSRSGQSDVIVEFSWGTDMDFAGIEVRERLDLLWLPVEATRPLLLRFDPSSEPVMRVAFVDETAGATSNEERLKFLRRFADDRIKPEIESVEGSAAVKVSGGFEDEVQIYVDQQRLAQLRLSIEHVARRIGAENVNLSGGRLEQGTQRFLVRTVNEFNTLEDMANAVIAVVDGQPVYLKDVARVERGYKDRTAITRLDGKECIELAIYKEGDANTVQLAHGIADRLESLGKTLPAGTRLVPVYDQSKFIASAVSDVKDAAILGGLLSILVLYFFLRDAWATIVTGIVIPVTVVGIFVMMYAFDLTLNVMSLGGIALSVGMLIDNSVVILEAIARRKEAGLSTLDAAREGTAEVATAVTASTLTSVAVFFPMVFVSGIAGQLFRDQALTVTFAQLISLMVGITLVPMLTAWRARLGEPAQDLAPDAGEPRETLGALRNYLRAFFANVPVRYPPRPTQNDGNFFVITWRATKGALRFLLGAITRIVRLLSGLLGKVFAVLLSPFVWATQKSYDLLDRNYPKLLDWALARRAAVLFTAFGMLAATAMILPSLGSELIPQLSQGEFTVKMRLPAGSPLETTDRQVQHVQVAARDLPNLDSAYSVAGTGNRLDANPVDSGENTGNLDVKLKAPIDKAGEERAMQSLREQLGGIPGAQYEFTRPSLLTLATPVEVVLSGYDLDRLSLAANAVRDRMERSGEFRDIRSSIEGGHPEIQILFDQERASQLGLAVRDIADRVVSNVRGSVATRYRLQEKKIDVLVRSVDTRAASIEEVRNLVVNPGSERPVPLSAVAEVRLATGPAEIRRANQERVAVISAAPAQGDLGEATRTAQSILAATTLPVGISGAVSGQSEEMTQSFRSLGLAFALAVFLVYLVMASQFESLLHPLVILFTIPMGLIGSIWGLYVTGTTINSVALIGLIMLAGIVVNNAIVLIDAINQARERGLSRIEAIKLAGRTRLRPILITSVSTIIGLIPMAIGIGEGAEIRRPMAITVIAGNLVATFLTLVVIPVLYSVMDRKEYGTRTAPAAGTGATALATPAAPPAPAHSPEK
ncbi:MAG TPA: efflux RND transporter permease subunit [Steroidobacteraceae bacterium]|nr:efflux RND transporter permease subunit [Steroidobacteraceae bacterium]